MAIYDRMLLAEEQFMILKELGCDQAQGYHITRPKLAAELIDF